MKRLYGYWLCALCFIAMIFGATQDLFGKATYKTPEVRSYCKGTDDRGYEWHGKYYKTTGQYEYIERDQAGDSTIYTLDLTVKLKFDSTIMLPICQHGSVEYNGKTYTEATEEILFDGQSKNGCDSIVRLKVFVAPSFHRYDTIQISHRRKPIEWHDQTITGAGTYFDQNFNIYGCDSTYELYVTLADTVSFLHITKDVICEKDTSTYEWRGRKYSYTGVITDEMVYEAQDGTDSIYSLYLVVQPQYEFTYNINLCPNSSTEYRGKTYSSDKPGVYYDTLYSAEGCDSVCKITVAVLDGGIIENKTIKQGDSYLWNLNGKTYTTTGRYPYPEKPVTSEEGCDLTNYLVLTVTPTHNITPENVLHCKTEESPTYLWHGKHYAQTGTYYDTTRVMNVLIPDTVYTLKLTVGAPKETHEYLELCKAGEPKTWHKQTISDEGLYYDTLRTKQGCDSVVILHATYNLIEDIYDTLPYAYREQWYEHTVGGTDTMYIHRVPSAAPEMCDTLKRRHIALCYPFKADMSDTICESRLIAGEEYIWEDIDGTNVPLRLNRDQYGRYHDSIFYTCTKNHSFYLHVLRERIKMDTINLCEGESEKRVLSDGSTVWFSEPGRTYDTIPEPGRGRFTCDSVVCYFVQVHKPKRDTVIVHVPDTTKQYIWNTEGKQIPVPVSQDLGYLYCNDTVSSLLRTSCDSIIHTLKLITDKTYFFTDTVRICRRSHGGEDDRDNRPYTWEGHLLKGKPYIIDKAGVYYDSLRTRYTNVDSVYQLVVDTFPNYLIQDPPVFLCQGDSLDWNGRWLKKAGTYRDTSYTVLYGCDSIHELVLNIIPMASPVTIKASISDQQKPYIWQRYDADGTLHSSPYTNTGIYSDKLVSSRGCDSIIYLDLTIHPTYEIKESAVICASETPYIWQNRQLWKSDVYRDTMQTVMRYDSIIELTLTVIDTTHTDVYYSICTGEAIILNNKTYDHGGLFRDTIPNRMGCDSVLIIHVEEMPVEMRSVEVNTTQPYTWAQNGKTYDDSGLYYDTIPAVGKGCDTIMRLVLTIYEKEQLREETISVCERDLPYHWHTKWLSKDTIVWYTIHSELVDTVWRLDFRVIRMEHDTINKILCDGEQFDFNGKTFTRDTIFSDTTFSGYGCGKAYFLNLKFRKPQTHNYTVTASDKKPYLWNIEDTTYVIKTDISEPYTECTHVVRTKDGLCDSIIHTIHVNIGKTYLFQDSIHLCLPDTLYWHGKVITNAGFYHDSLRTKGLEFDSVYHLKVTADKDTIIYENYNIMAGTYLVMHGIDISQPGVYWDTVISEKHGCNIIYKMTVNTKRTVELKRDSTICAGDYYDFYGKRLTKSGDYTYVSPAEDTIVYLSLNVHPTDILREDIVITPEDLPYVHHNRRYDNGGLQTDTLKNRYNCDSIVIVNLVVSKHYSDWDYIPLCSGSNLLIGDSIITKSGPYTFVRPSLSTGKKDSLYRVFAYDAPAYDLPTDTITICEGDTAVYAGKRLYQAGAYDFAFKTVRDGCDSLMHAFVKVNKIYRSDEIATIADYESYKWFGRSYDTTGVYTYTLPTRDFCDSLFTLRLTVVKTSRAHTEDTICLGSTYTWRGQQYTEAGYYVDTVRQLENNTSAIYTLHLVTVKQTIISSAKVTDICADTESFDIDFEYTGQKPTHYSVYFGQQAKREGFEDIIEEPFGNDLTIHVDLPKFASIAYAGHPYYVRPDYYTLHLALDNGICGISRSDSLRLLIKYPSWIIEQNGSDMVMPLKAELNGGYEFAQMEWYVNGVVQNNTAAGYLYSKDMHEGDQVVLVATRKGENSAIPTCPLIIRTPEPAVNDFPVLVYPTYTPQQMPIIRIEALRDGQYDVYSYTGMHITEGSLSGGQAQLTLPSVSGIYIIRVSQGDQVTSHKVILY